MKQSLGVRQTYHNMDFGKDQGQGQDQDQGQDEDKDRWNLTRPGSVNCYPIISELVDIAQ